MAKSPSASSSEKAVLPSIRTTAEIKHSIKEKARQAQMSVSDYILACALQRPIPTRPSQINREAYIQLSQQVVSTDELVKQLRLLQQKPWQYSEDIQPLLCAILDRIHRQEQLMTEIHKLLLYGKNNSFEDKVVSLGEGGNPAEFEL